MNHSVKIGFSFGLTSGVITTLGLLIGLATSTESTIIVIEGILLIAIADAFSDSLGIHISEESENKHNKKQIWQSTLATFIAKFATACSFLIPILLLPLKDAVAASITWGLLLTGAFSYYIGKKEKNGPVGVVAEHLFVTVIVIIATAYAGILIRSMFS